MLSRGRLTLVIFSVLIFTLLPLSNPYPTAKGETEITFTPNDRFNVASFNGSIRFATNGSYTAATLTDGKWAFTNLRLNDSQTPSTLIIGVKDSNVTILLLTTFNFSGRSTFLRYIAQGMGSQSVKLDLNSSRKTSPYEWSVIVPGTSGAVWLVEGQNWNLEADNTVVINDLVGDVSVWHFNVFTQSDGSHSILFITAIVFAIVVAVAVVIRIKVKAKT